MTISSLKFGTSGLRGLAVELEGQAARRYVAAFLRHVQGLGQLGGGKVFIGRDFRPSSPAIAKDCAAAIGLFGLEAVDCGTVPTPALALHAMAAGCCAIMITGSHIPSDRNGLKFYVPGGEISKADEAGIVAALRDEVVPDSAAGMRDEFDLVVERYVARYAGLLPEDADARARAVTWIFAALSTVEPPILELANAVILERVCPDDRVLRFPEAEIQH